MRSKDQIKIALKGIKILLEVHEGSPLYVGDDIKTKILKAEIELLEWVLKGDNNK